MNLGISVLKEADDEAVREQGYTEDTRPLNASIKSQWISASGVPIILLQVIYIR